MGECIAVDTDGEENESSRKCTAVLPAGGVGATKTETMKALYASVRLLGTEEEDIINFTDWKGFDEY